MFQEFPYERLARQVQLGKPTGRRSEVIQGLGVVNTSLTLLALVLLWSQLSYLKLLLTVTYSKSP